jgi:peptide/nickel transport system permease protein
MAYLVGDPGLLTAEQLATIRRNLGLDRPLWGQYLTYIGSLARADLGWSVVNQRPVIELILERIPATLLLMASSQLLALLFGLVAGFSAAYKAGRPLDFGLGILSVLTYSMPPFWLALVFILVFSLTLEWFPTMGMTSLGASYTGWAHVADVGRHLFLPAMALGTSYAALYMKVFRTSLLNVFGQPFVTTARAKGLSWCGIYLKHAARNAALPVVTFVGIQAGLLLTGGIVTEIVFAWPGIGLLAMNAILQRDYPLILGIFVVISLCVVVANAVADVVYSVVDPRIAL